MCPVAEHKTGARRKSIPSNKRRDSNNRALVSLLRIPRTPLTRSHTHTHHFPRPITQPSHQLFTPPLSPNTHIHKSYLFSPPLHNPISTHALPSIHTKYTTHLLLFFSLLTQLSHLLTNIHINPNHYLLLPSPFSHYLYIFIPFPSSLTHPV